MPDGHQQEWDGNPPSPSPEGITKVNEFIGRLNELERRKNPAAESMLKYFANEHLHEPMQTVSGLFKSLAELLVETDVVIDERERQVALRKLLEAKDAAVRSVISRD